MHRAEHKALKGARQRSKPAEMEGQPQKGQKRKNDDVQDRQTKQSRSRGGGKNDIMQGAGKRRM
jgi:hypothetical protein